MSHVDSSTRVVVLTRHQRVDRMRQPNTVVPSGISSLSVDLKEREKIRRFSCEKRKEYTKAHKLVIREEFNRAGVPLKLNAARLENCVLFYRRVSREALKSSGLRTAHCADLASRWLRACRASTHRRLADVKRMGSGDSHPHTFMIYDTLT